MAEELEVNGLVFACPACSEVRQTEAEILDHYQQAHGEATEDWAGGAINNIRGMLMGTIDLYVEDIQRNKLFPDVVHVRLMPGGEVHEMRKGDTLHLRLGFRVLGPDVDE